jgi:short subunit dehydrogenase-like uncharacterized protein
MVTVFGAYGRTGRFVVSELRKRRWKPVLSGRDVAKLNALADDLSLRLLQKADVVIRVD